MLTFDVTYSTGKRTDNITAITKNADPRDIKRTHVSGTMFRGDLSDTDAVIEHCRKVLEISTGREVLIFRIAIL